MLNDAFPNDRNAKNVVAKASEGDAIRVAELIFNQNKSVKSACPRYNKAENIA